MSSREFKFQGLSILDTTVSTNKTSGALYVAGGVGFEGAMFGADVTFDGIFKNTNTTQSTNSSTGSSIFSGGVAIQKNLMVGGNTIINGDLTVLGETASIITTTISISDNTLQLNSGPTGTRDAGILITRYQVDNDAGSGDVVNDVSFLSDTFAVGSDVSNLVFPSGFSAVNDFYNSVWVKVTSGDANLEVRQIVSYVGSTRTATLSSPLGSAPSDTDTFSLYNKSFVTSYWNTSSNEYVFGFTKDNVDITADISDSSLANIRSLGMIATNSTITNLYVSNLSANGLTLSNATMSSLFVSDLTATNSTLSSALVINGTIGTLHSTDIVVSNVDATLISTGNLIADVAFVTDGTIGTLHSTNVVVSNVDATLISTGNLIADAAFVTDGTIGTLHSTDIVVSNVDATLISAGNLIADTAFVTDGTIGTLHSTDIVVSNVDATLISAGNLIADAAFVTDGTIGTLHSTDITSSSVDATLISAGNLIVDDGTIGNLSSSNFTTTYSTVGSMVLNGVLMDPNASDIISEKTFSAANGISSFTDITGLSFAPTVRAFSAILSSTILTVGDVSNKYTFYEVKGVFKGTNWLINANGIGDLPNGIALLISTSGNVQYTSSSVGSFVSNTLKFKANTVTV